MYNVHTLYSLYCARISSSSIRMIISMLTVNRSSCLTSHCSNTYSLILNTFSSIWWGITHLVLMLVEGMVWATVTRGYGKSPGPAALVHTWMIFWWQSTSSWVHLVFRLTSLVYRENLEEDIVGYKLLTDEIFGMRYIHIWDLITDNYEQWTVNCAGGGDLFISLSPISSPVFRTVSIFSMFSFTWDISSNTSSFCTWGKGMEGLLKEISAPFEPETGGNNGGYSTREGPG